MQELPKIVAETDVGKTVRVKVWRSGKEISKKITPMGQNHGYQVLT